MKVFGFQKLGSLSSTGGLSELCLKFATLQNQTHLVIFHYIYDSFYALTSFIKGQCIKQCIYFSLIYIYFVLSRLLLSFAQIIEHCLYHSTIYLWCIEARILGQGNTFKKIIFIFKTEKVVRSP